MTPVKEPSELDYTLVRDFIGKLRGVYYGDGGFRFSSFMSREHIEGYAGAIERMSTYSSKMGDEITRLVLEKHQRD